MVPRGQVFKAQVLPLYLDLPSACCVCACMWVPQCVAGTDAARTSASNRTLNVAVTEAKKNSVCGANEDARCSSEAHQVVA